MVIDRSDEQKLIRIAKLREELRSMGYSIIPTFALAALVAEARHQGMLEYAK